MSLGVGLENDEVSVVLGPYLNFGAITPDEAAVVADPDPERGFVRRRDGRLSRLAREEKWE
jgi:hypothetical protein